MTAASGPQPVPGGPGGPTPSPGTPQPTKAATEPERCRSCGAPVLWRRHVRTGKWAPIDAKPDPAGNVQLQGERGYRITSTPDLLGGDLYSPHYSTCPQAGAWRGR